MPNVTHPHTATLNLWTRIPIQEPGILSHALLAYRRHPDFVITVAVHPKDDKLFLSGSIDGKVSQILSFSNERCHLVYYMRMC